MTENSLCRNNLHERPEGIRTCVPCKRVANRRYDASVKGQAAHLVAYQRYRYSTKGILRDLRPVSKETALRQA